MPFKYVNIDGLNIFYREAGKETAPKLVLLHGFLASSHQYRNLIPALADRFHVIAPDYPGIGNSDMPDPAKFSYTFDNPLCARSGHPTCYTPTVLGGRNLMTAIRAIKTKMANTAARVIAKGGSV